MNDDENRLLSDIYNWVDSVPLSRPKKNLARDFSDGVLMAEIIKFHIPQLIEIHNYPSASSVSQKTINWNTLSQKALKKLHINISKEETDGIITCQPYAIENILKKVYFKLKDVEPKGLQEFGMQDNKDDFNNQSGKGNAAMNKREENYKAIILEKDKTIMELTSTLEILEMKLANSDEENKKLNDRVEFLKNKLKNAGKL